MNVSASPDRPGADPVAPPARVGTAPGSHVAGYRVLRALARGERGEVLLAVEPPSESSAADDAALPAPVVLKLPVAAAPASEPARHELEALDRAAGPHVVRLIDAATLAELSGRWCLVLERLEGPSLATLMAARASWPAGEVVTVLAPLAQTIARLHERGVAHGAFAPQHVLLDRRGAPVLVGFGEAQLFAPGSPEVVRERLAGVRADREALRSLAVRLLGLVEGQRSRDAVGLATRLSEVPGAQLCEVLVRELFALAAAQAVSTAGRDVTGESSGDAPGDASVAHSRGRALEPREASWPLEDAEVATPRTLVSLVSGLAPDGWLEAVERRLPAQWAAAFARLRETCLERLRPLQARWAALAQGPRRLLVAVASVAVVLAVSGAILPSDDGTSEAEVPAGETGAGETGAEQLGPEQLSDDATLDAEHALDDPVRGDDPLVAARALLDRRAECYRELSILCLDSVAQPGSAALDDDRSAIQALHSGAPADELVIPIDAMGELELVEQLGGSALVRLGTESTAASLLMIRGEAGWRIRDYLAAAGAQMPS